jgi:hypothetical protein
MGDDMSTSTAGFADPFASSHMASETEDGDEIIASGY